MNDGRAHNKVKQPDDRTEQLFAQALAIGFGPVGVCHAEPAATFPAFARWLGEIMHNGTCNGMAWLVRHCEARRHPMAVLPDVKSLIVVGMSYGTVNPTAAQPSMLLPDGFGLVAEYARGHDYHDVMRAKLRQLAKSHCTLFPHAKTRIAVDTAPLLEREFAVRVGLGRPGKNTMLINRQHGSRFFLGVLLSTAELHETVCDTTMPLPVTFDSPEQHSFCGTCQRCVNACPTGALATPYRLNAHKCINYWSIEHPGNDIPGEIADKFGNRLFGCDICQNVCPFNKPNVKNDASLGDLALLSLRRQLESGMMSLSQIENLDENEFQRQFSGTPFMRLGLVRLKRNAAIVQANAKK